MRTQLALLCLAAATPALSAVTYAVPNKVGTGGRLYAPLDPSPVGLSFEFFAFPSYFSNVTATNQCLSNWKDLTGTWPRIRIGGTTQDRASYDASTSAYVVYNVANAADAPMTLTFGPRFFTLANSYPGEVVVGLNRGKNNLQNTIAAAKVAVSEMQNLMAIELGNEPEYYPKDGQPIASGTWNNQVDAVSQANWALAVGTAVGRKNIIQSCNSNALPPEWGAETVIAAQNATVKQYIFNYAHHNYPGGSVQSLQSHATTSSNVRRFDADIAAALREKKQYVFGETNSVSGGGAAGVSPTFGAALWTMDYSLRLTYSNVSRTYFHQGTVGNCQYCFFGRYSMGAPYYGATAAIALMGGASHLTALDDGRGPYAGYAAYDAEGKPLRVLLYNSDYYAGSGDRGSNSFTLTGLEGVTSVRAKRLTAGSAMVRQDQGGTITFGGQSYGDGTCVPQGAEAWETTQVANGQATFNVKATEALVVYLQ